MSICKSLIHYIIINDILIIMINDYKLQIVIYCAR